MAKKTTALPGLRMQKQLFYVAGHLNEPVDGSTSWTFYVHADTGEDAYNAARNLASRYGYVFTMELCTYARGPRVKRGIAGYGRMSS